MKLRYGYLTGGIVIGLILVFSFILNLPDGRLHIVFCSVGQGDATYIRFPDGRDMLFDGGPDATVLTCLGRHMPFWDRTIDLVALSHPQKDHLAGLLPVLARFHIGYFLRTDIGSDTQGFRDLLGALETNHVPVRLLTAGDRIDIGDASLSVLWPSPEQIARAPKSDSVLGAATGEMNDYSLVLYLQYGLFDGVFPGDADSHVEDQYQKLQGINRPVDVLKVPHHGSKTGLTRAYVDWVGPRLSVISVGKNSYGHPAKEIVDMLQNVGSRVLRTDESRDIEVVSDGKSWYVP